MNDIDKYQDHILPENIWFVWSETSYCGDEMRCYQCGTTNNEQTVKIELLSQWKLEAEFRNYKNTTFEYKIIKNTNNKDCKISHKI